MMQVYDRVMHSRSVPTLLYLTLIVALCYVTYAILDAVRGCVLSGVSDLVEDRLGRALIAHVTTPARRAQEQALAVHIARDLDTVRQFAAGCRRAGVHRSALGADLSRCDRVAAPVSGAVRGGRGVCAARADAGDRTGGAAADGRGRPARRPRLSVRRGGDPLCRLRAHHGPGRDADRTVARTARRYAVGTDAGQPPHGLARRHRQMRADVLPVDRSWASARGWRSTTRSAAARSSPVRCCSGERWRRSRRSSAPGVRRWRRRRR